MADNGNGIYIRILGEIDKAIEEALKNIGKAMEHVGEQAEIANKKTEKAFDPEMFRKFENETRNIGTRLGTVFDPLFGAMAKGAAAVTAAVSGIAAASLAVGGGFEQQMTLVKGVAGATAEEFGRLTAMAETLGAKLPVSAAEAAQAMYEMASAGMDADEILKAVGDTVNLSISQNYSLAESANTLVSTLKIFSLGADEAGKVVDLFNNAANQSMLNMSKLANAMVYAGPSAHSLGMSLEQTVAAMEALSQAGLDGSMIGTGLRQVLSSLVSPSKEASEVFARMGLQIYDAAGKMRPFADIMRDVSAAGLTAQDAFAAFGDRGATAVQVLAQASDQLERYEAGLRQAGSAQQQVEEQMKTWPNVLKSLTSAIEALELKVFSGIKGSAKALVDEITDMVNAFGEWADRTKVLSLVISEFFAGFGIAVPTVEQFKAALAGIDVSALGARFRELASTISAVAEAFVDFAKAVPWTFLLNHLKEIAAFIAAGWVASKVFFLISALSGLAGACVTLAGASGLGALATVLGAPVVGLIALFGLAAIMAKGLWDEFEEGGKAVEAFNGTLGKTLDQLKELGAETLKQRISALEGQIEKMQMRMAGPNGSGTESPQLKLWKEQLASLKEALSGIEGDQKALTDFDRQTEAMKKKVDDFRKSLNAGASQSTSQAAPQIQAPSFADSVSGALKQSIDGFAAYMGKLTSEAQAMVQRYGLAASDAALAIKTQLLTAATSAADELVKKFDNPLMRTLFGTALRRMGEAGKNQMLAEIGAAISGSEEKLKAFQAKMDEFKKAQEEYEKQRQSLDEQVASGDARLIAMGPDGATYQRKTGMRYGDAPKTDYEKRFNEPVYGDPFTVNKPTAPTPDKEIKGLVDPALSGVDQLEKALKGVGDRMMSLTGFQDLPAEIAKSLESVSASGASAGGSAGAKFGQAFLDNSQAAIRQVVEAINGIPDVVKVTVTKSGTGGGLAGAVQSAARG